MRNYLGLVTLTLATAAQTCVASPLCTELRHDASRPNGLGQAFETIEIDPDGEWNHRIPNVDVDGDSEIDEILMFKSDSPSRRPADWAKIKITLSTSGKTFSAELPHISLVLRKSSYLIIGTTYTEGGWSKQLDIRRMDRAGITTLCTLNMPVPVRSNNSFKPTPLRGAA